MKATSRGQVTIPQEIRERPGVLPSTEVEWEIDGDTARLRKTNGTRSRGWALVKHMRGRGTSQMTTVEIMALTRGKPRVVLVGSNVISLPLAADARRLARPHLFPGTAHHRPRALISTEPCRP